MILPTLAARAVRQVAPTLTWRVEGLERWDRGVVLTCWHGQIVLGAAFLSWLGRAEECWAPIVPTYGQSRAMSHFARCLGLQPVFVPGYEESAARRAKLLTLVPPLRAGQSLFMAADGHRAPARLLSDDLVDYVVTARLPLQPVALAARPSLALPTWDRKCLPLPGSRVAVAIGERMEGRIQPAEVTARLDALERLVQEMLEES